MGVDAILIALAGGVVVLVVRITIDQVEHFDQTFRQAYQFVAGEHGNGLGEQVSDPANALVGLGALCALVAARYWWRVSFSVDTSGEVVKGPNKPDLSSAAFLTAITLALVSFGYLLGRFSGKF